MRKVISFGLLCLIFLIITPAALADDEDDCEDLRTDGSPRALYGLCIAVARAGNDNAVSHIDENMAKMVSDDCPCWELADLQGALGPIICPTVTGYDWVIFNKDFGGGPVPVQALAGLVPVEEYPESTSCAYFRSDTAATTHAPTTAGQDYNCRLDVLSLCP